MSSNLSPIFDLDPKNDPKPEEIPSFQWPQMSAFAREMRSWETRNRRPGWTPEGNRYPLMLCKAVQKLDPATGEPSGKFFVTDPYDESIARRATRTVQNEQEEQALLADGWVEGVQEALKRAMREQDEIARVAAHRRYEDRGMSDAAKAEVRQAEEDAGLDHVPAKPEARLDKRSRAYRDAKKQATSAQA
jgi:hypothetical protein